MDRQAPHETVRILRSALDDPNGNEVARALERLRHRWLAWARRRYPRLEADHEDAVQEASVLVVRRIDQLRDPDRVDAWCNSVFASVLREILAKRGRAWKRHASVPVGVDPDAVLHGLPDMGPTTEERASDRERLRIVEGLVSSCAAARLKLEGLSEREIGEQTGLSRDAIATVLKRVRKVLRRVLEETDEDGFPLSTDRILDRTGLPRDVVNRLAEAVERVLHRDGEAFATPRAPADAGSETRAATSASEAPSTLTAGGDVTPRSRNE